MVNAPAPPPPPPPPPQAPPVPAPPAPVAAPVAAVTDPGYLAPDLAARNDEAERTPIKVLTSEEARAAALDTSDVSQANSATGVYGDSGTGKTSQMATAIEYTWETYKKISHFYAADLGGYGNKLIKLAKLGIVRIYAPRNHVEPFETAELISMGYFPETIGDPITGYADPYVRLIPPQMRRYTVYCPNGHAFPVITSKARLSSFQQQCQTCRMLTTLANWTKVEEQIITSPGFKHVGLRLYDSGTALQDWVMEDLAGKAAKEEFGAKNNLAGAGAKVVSGEMIFGSNQISHFGFAQNRMPSWIANSRRIPGNLVPPIWSFLEQRGKDEGNIVIFGPSIAGNARTSDVPSWLGNCLHLAKVPDASGKMINRIYLQNHSSVNEGNIPHLAKHRGDAGTMPEYLEDGPNDPPFTKCSLKYFFTALEVALQKSLQAGVEQYTDAPALVGLGDDDQEEILSVKDVSKSAAPPSYQSPTVTGPIAGVAAGGPAGAGFMGVPAPPPPMGVPQAPPVAGGVPVAPPVTQAQTLPPPAAPPAGVPGPRPPVPVAAVAAPPVAQPAAAAPVVGSPAPGAPPVAVAAPQPAAPAGGAPVRPPVTTATVAPSPAAASPARASRPPVPPPPGPPQS